MKVHSFPSKKKKGKKIHSTVLSRLEKQDAMETEKHSDGFALDDDP